MGLSPSQYDEILTEYDRTRLLNRRKNANRIQEVHAAVPRIAEIDREIADSSINAARQSLQGIAVDKEALRVQRETLIQEKYRCLEAAGYPKDYLAPIYRCSHCQDTGYIDNERCECFHKAIIKRLYQQSNMQQMLEIENFSSFQLDYYSNQQDGTHSFSPRQNMEHIYSRLQNYIANFSKQHDNILFQGNTGVGKTFLTNCIAKELLEQGYTVLYLNATNLFDNVIADVVMNKNQQEDSLFIYKLLNTCDVLIIDDLGTEYTNNFVASHLYSLLNERMQQHRATIVSTNLSIAEIGDRYSERIMSRIIDSYLICNIYGEDIRIKRRRDSINKSMNT